MVTPKSPPTPALAAPEPSPEQIVRDEKAQLDFSEAMSYGDYLQLDSILNAQKPLSPAHDELLFIVQHQTSELWMKLMLHELNAAMRCVAADELGRAFKMLARVSRIMEQLVHAWDVLATMTPPEYTAMRPYLGASSGFQSYQYRCIEYSLGNKNLAMLKPHAHRPDLLARVRAALDAPSLYDEALRLLARRGLPLSDSEVERDWTQPYVASDAVEQAWLQVYRAPKTHWDLYQLAEELVDLEDAFRLCASAMSPRLSGSLASSVAPAALAASVTCAKCLTWCCSQSCGGCARSCDPNLRPLPRRK